MTKDFAAKRNVSRGGLTLLLLAGIVLLCFCAPPKAGALETGVSGFSVMGILNQSAAYALHDNNAANKDGFNAFVTQGILETKYEPSDNLAFFTSLKFNADWAYPVYSGNNEWKEKGFRDADKRLFIYTHFRDILGEAHITWKPTDRFYFRIGKQIVQWGQTDGFLLMNQINPIDQRRGITDVEFENTVLPIWLLRAEYRPPVSLGWLQDMNLQFIWNPNADFAKNESIELGAGYSGVWNPYVEAIPGVAYLARYRDIVSEPSSWSGQGQAFAFRASANILNSIVTLNGYYGRSHEMARSGIIGYDMESFKWDSTKLLFHPWYEAYYPIFRFVGGTFTKDLEFLSASALGGVAPVIRFETLYAFDNTFSTNNNNAAYYMQEQGNNFWTSDEFRWMVGFDWKVKVDALNPKAYFMISPQIYQRHIVDYPSQGHLGTATTDILYKNTWTTSLMVNTTYLHNKLQPSFFWLRNWSDRSEFWRPQIAYEYSTSWKYTLGAMIFSGSKLAQGMQPFSQKDHVYGTVSYKF
jgi:hypothetical protein